MLDQAGAPEEKGKGENSKGHEEPERDDHDLREFPPTELRESPRRICGADWPDSAVCFLVVPGNNKALAWWRGESGNHTT